MQHAVALSEDQVLTLKNTIRDLEATLQREREFSAANRTINVEYLVHILRKFLLAANPAERAKLVPVLCQILHLRGDDAKAINDKWQVKVCLCVCLRLYVTSAMDRVCPCPTTRLRCPASIDRSAASWVGSNKPRPTASTRHSTTSTATAGWAPASPSISPRRRPSPRWGTNGVLSTPHVPYSRPASFVVVVLLQKREIKPTEVVSFNDL